MILKHPCHAPLLALAVGFFVLGIGEPGTAARTGSPRTVTGKVRPGRSPFLNLRLQQVPSHGLVVTPLDLRNLAGAVGRQRAWNRFRPSVTAGGTRVPAQWAPNFDFDGRTRFGGTLVLKLPHGGQWRAQLRATFDGSATRVVRDREQMVETSNFTLYFDPLETGGFPANITFAKTGRIFEKFAWNDRLVDADANAFSLANDRQATLQVLSEGVLCTILRSRARYVTREGVEPDSRPVATYDWYVFNKLPLVFVSGQAQQEASARWKEFHFLELNLRDGSFRSFAGGEPFKSGHFKADNSETPLNDWGALISDQNAIGMFGGRSLIYDGRAGLGRYLHFAQPEPAQGWSGAVRRFSAWLWIGSAPEPATAVRSASQLYTRHARVSVTTPLRRRGYGRLASSAGK